MKQINILKKAAGAILILLLLLSLAACGNMLEETKENAVVEPVETAEAGILVRGEIKVQGAVPSRAATSCFDGDFSWRITAQNLDITDYTDPNFLANSFTTTNRFTITLPCAGNWLISASGYAGTFTKETLPSSSEVFSGFDSFTITKEGSNRAIVIHPVVWGDSLFPTQGANPLKGSINLPITSNAENVYQVSAKLIKNNSTTTATEEVVTIPPKTFTAGSSSLEASDVPAGFYTAKIIFEDSIGNILYSCHEGISVYPGLTTDTWYGIAPYLNNGAFTLTSTLVEKFGAELVPSTNYVLYNYEQGGPEVNGEKKYNYYFVNGNDLENPLSSPAVTSLAVGDSSSIIDARCFDSEGNLYLLQMSYDYQNDMALQSTKTDWTAPNMIQKLGINYGYVRNLAITSDFKTNKFYIFVIDQDADTTVNVNCYPNILDSNGVTTTKISKSLEFGGGSLGSYYFVVNNDKLYMLSTSQGVSNPYTLRIYDLSLLSGNSSSINYSKSISIDLLSILGVDAVKGEISDMLYQDGCLYMLYKEVSNYEPEPDVYSRGGVIQYNLLTGSTLFKGFTTNCIAKNSGYTLQAITRDSYGNQYLLYMDASGNEPFIPEVNKNDKYLDIYCPGENETSFYGPTKFIAIKPKQLVISDEGFAYYTNNGLLYRKNINRVAIVDLENFAIEFKNINSSLSMDKNCTENLLTTNSVGLNATDVYYKKDGDNYTSFSSDCCFLSVTTEE